MENKALVSVVEYSESALYSIFKTQSFDVTEPSSKTQCLYLGKYLLDLGAKTIVIEEGYTDRDYLEDYAAYYVRCFDKYRSRCTRLHFFSLPFTAASVENISVENTEGLKVSDLQGNYLGFVVVKPLPRTFIGRTCLQTFQGEARRFYGAIRTYEVHLFGLRLAVETLAYQEQDSVLAACATSALWSAFQATGRMFQHAILSPVEITRIATKNPVRAHREFPNSSLQPVQIGTAISSVGLEPEMLIPVNTEIFKAAVFAYLTAGIPIVLGGMLYDPNVTDPETGGYAKIEGHAVTICGYSLDSTAPLPPEYTPQLFSARIDRIYVHDDGVGPFARLVFSDLPIEFPKDKRLKPIDLNLDMIHPTAEGERTIKFAPSILIVPLYHKIRISLTNILDMLAKGLDVVFALLATKRPDLFASPIEWEVRLMTEYEVKKEIRASGTLPGGNEKRLLFTQMPRFVWRVRGLQDGQMKVICLYDATDIAQNSLLFHYGIDAVFQEGILQMIAEMNVS